MIVFNKTFNSITAGVLNLLVLAYPKIIILFLYAPSNKILILCPPSIGGWFYIDKRLEWVYFEDIFNFAYPLLPACIRLVVGVPKVENCCIPALHFSCFAYMFGNIQSIQ